VKVSTGNHEVAITSLWNDSTYPFRFNLPKPQFRPSLANIMKSIDSVVDFFVGNHSLGPQNEKLKQKYQKYAAKVAERLKRNTQAEKDVPFFPELYYSFNYGNVHWIALDTESQFDTPFVSEYVLLFLTFLIEMSNFLRQHKQQQQQFVLSICSVQVEWLKHDLKIANQNRHKQPWIIVFGHRALYCSNYGILFERFLIFSFLEEVVMMFFFKFEDNDCTLFADYLRHKLEDVLYEYKVDLVIGAHKHGTSQIHYQIISLSLLITHILLVSRL
jgi:hypothetical protein